jgi:flagellin-like hook-associated protein FlgL
MIGGIGTRSALGAQSLVEMRRQLDDLQRQLATGRKADTYAGVGLDRGLLVGLRSRVDMLEGFESTIVNVNVRIDLAQSALGRLADIGRAVKSAAFQSPQVESDGTTVAQTAAYSSLGEILGLLNTKVGDRYIFSGSGVDRPAVATLAQIMDGEGTRAGFKQVVSERAQADIGATGLGRLVLSAPIPAMVQVTEDVPGSPFGFKVAGIASSLTNSIASGPNGTPVWAALEFTGLPNSGETVQYQFTLPDGTSETLTLKATTSATPGPDEFTIGPTAVATAGNLQAALTTAIERLAATALPAASAVAAADNFFNGTPQRVAGPPFDSATALVAGTSSNTVAWYTGEDGASPARATATARVDMSIGVSYGMRASEEGVRWLLQNVAALAAVTYAPGDANAAARSSALHARIANNLDVPPGTQTVENIQAELAGAQGTLHSTSERHRQTRTTLAGMMEQIEGIPTEEVATKILALQTRLQASLQTTSLLHQISLVNYL